MASTLNVYASLTFCPRLDRFCCETAVQFIRPVQPPCHGGTTGRPVLLFRTRYNRSAGSTGRRPPVQPVPEGQPCLHTMSTVTSPSTQLCTYSYLSIPSSYALVGGSRSGGGGSSRQKRPRRPADSGDEVVRSSATTRRQRSALMKTKAAKPVAKMSLTEFQRFRAQDPSPLLVLPVGLIRSSGLFSSAALWMTFSADSRTRLLLCGPLTSPI